MLAILSGMERDVFCKQCRQHQYLIRYGKKKIKGSDPVQRYYCKQCKTVVTRRSLNPIESGLHQKGLSYQIFHESYHGQSNRAIARRFNISEQSVRIRLRRMAKYILLRHTELLKNAFISEDITYDGLRNFAISKFDPNEINHAVGAGSHFIYDFSFSPLNRTGKMSEKQQAEKLNIEASLGTYPEDAVQLATQEILKRLLQKSDGIMNFHTDGHYLYKRAIKAESLEDYLEHVTTSAKKHRGYTNPLFPVNYIDSYIRDEVAAFRRETTAFAKTHNGMIDKYIIYMAYKNYMRPKYFKKQKVEEQTNTHSPAMYLGITKKILTPKQFFSTYIDMNPESLSEEWQLFYNKTHRYQRQLAA